VTERVIQIGDGPWDSGEPEVPLIGGDVTEGLVRVGGTVRRPVSSSSDGVRLVLDHLHRHGFDGAPRYLGRDREGRDVLTFVEGEVASRPWPDWVATPERIISVARLTRAYDDTVAMMDVPDWARALRIPDPPGAPPSIAGEPEIIGHLDITPENVVFRNGSAFALIDFDLIRPAARAEEVCNLLQWWAPWMPPGDREEALRSVDPVARSALLVDAYGLDSHARQGLVDLALNAAERSWHLMRLRSESLGGGWRRMWDEGVGEKILRRTQWIWDNRHELAAAVAPD
jgi:hypothetical protein